MRIRKLASLLVILAILLEAVRFTATAALDEPHFLKPVPDRIPLVSTGPLATAPIEPSTQPPYALVSTSSASTRTDIETSTIIAGESPDYGNYPMACLWVELVNEDFETWAPTDWSIVNNGGDCVWRAGSTGDDDNYTGGSGDYARGWFVVEEVRKAGGLEDSEIEEVSFALDGSVEASFSWGS